MVSLLGIDVVYAGVGAVVGVLAGHVYGGKSLSDVSVDHLLEAEGEHRRTMMMGGGIGLVAGLLLS